MMTNTPKNPAAVALGRLGGAKKSAAKAVAARRNGLKGGRPLYCSKCGERIRGYAIKMPNGWLCGLCDEDSR